MYESVVERNWQNIFLLANNGDEAARTIVLRYYKKDENEVFHRVVRWAKEGNLIAKKFVLESCPEKYVQELAECGDLDATKRLAVLGDRAAIDKMVAIGDWKLVKESAAQKKGRFNQWWNVTYALEKLIENDRIKELEELFPIGGMKLIRIIAHFEKLEIVKKTTADNLALQDAIARYHRSNMNAVEIGSVVTVRDCKTKRESTYCIVDKKKEHFSHDVPQVYEVLVDTRLGKALYRSKIGDIVEFRASVDGIRSKDKAYEIIEINFIDNN